MKRRLYLSLDRWLHTILFLTAMKGGKSPQKWVTGAILEKLQRDGDLNKILYSKKDIKNNEPHDKGEL